MKHPAPHPDAFDADACRDIAQGLADLEGALLPILHAVQDRFGYIDDAALPVIAEVLNLSRAEVHGVVTFYHDFRREPARRHVVKVCRAEACQALGAQRLYDEVRAACADGGDVTVEAVYCLGNCALSPAALIDGDLHGRLDTARTLDLVRGT
jgi:formate dehydrogenase subunit gamma